MKFRSVGIFVKAVVQQFLALYSVALFVTVAYSGTLCEILDKVPQEYELVYGKCTVLSFL